jgi:hypothetical protein
MLQENKARKYGVGIRSKLFCFSKCLCVKRIPFPHFFMTLPSSISILTRYLTSKSNLFCCFQRLQNLSLRHCANKKHFPNSFLDEMPQHFPLNNLNWVVRSENQRKPDMDWGRIKPRLLSYEKEKGL